MSHAGVCSTVSLGCSGSQNASQSLSTDLLVRHSDTIHFNIDSLRSPPASIPAAAMSEALYVPVFVPGTFLPPPLPSSPATVARWVCFPEQLNWFQHRPASVDAAGHVEDRQSHRWTLLHQRSHEKFLLLKGASLLGSEPARLGCDAWRVGGNGRREPTQEGNKGAVTTMAF